MAKKIVSHTFTDGINTDIAEELLAGTAYRYALNVRVLSTGNGSQGIITNTKGNVEVVFDLPEGENVTIGSKEDTENNKFYYFNYNSGGFHGIYCYDALQNKIQKILQSRTDTGGKDILRFDKYALILHIDIIGGLISWVDGINPARKFNIAKALDKSATGYGDVILEEYINAYKLAPIFAPTLYYFTDPLRLSNYVYGKLFKATVRHLFEDKEQSNWSEYSTVPLPTGESLTGNAALSSLNNGLKIVVETGGKTVQKLEIAIQSTAKDSDGVLNFESIIVLDKARLGIADNSTYEYTFYNDNVSYSGTSQEKIIRPYSFLPDEPTVQAYTKNAMVYGGGKEGFEPVDIDISVAASYGEPLFLPGEVTTDINHPQFEASLKDKHKVRIIRILKNDVRWDSLIEVTVGHDVKALNHFRLYGVNSNRSDNVYFDYIAGNSDDAVTVANKFKQKLFATGRVITTSVDEGLGGPEGTPGLPITSIWDSTVDGDGNVTFRFIWKGKQRNRSAEPVTHFRGSVEGVQYDTLKNNGQSLGTHKSGGSVKYGIIYWDQFTKRSLTYTADEAFVRTDFVTETSGYKKIVHTLSVKHRPPLWAKYWEVVRTEDLTYGDYVHVLTQQAIESQTTDDSEYIDLVIDGFFTYQRIHTDTVVTFDFAKNDRIRLIGKGYPGVDYYDFYETVVLDYKTAVEEVKNETVVTNKTNPTVIVPLANTDNIGKFMWIDGAERKITEAAGDTYTLDRPLNFGEDANLTYPYYKIIDRRTILRVRKPEDLVIEDNSLIEVYKPTSNRESSEKNFYLFGQKYAITDWGTANRAHAGNVQNQDPANLSGTPALVSISQGTSYVRNRELPTNNIIPGTQAVIDLIEDAGYSDYYPSELNDNGKVSPEDTGIGVVRLGSRLRFSNNYIEGTGVNGLSDFDNLDRKDYNDPYGDFMRLVYRESILMCFKALKTGYVPILATIIQDQRGQNLLGASATLLNELQYFAHEGGIGNHPESYASNGTWMWFCSANSGTICRTGGDGILPVSEQFGLDTRATGYLQNAAKYGSRIFGGFDRQSGEYIPSFERYNKYLYNGGFGAGWTLFSPMLAEDTVYEITTQPLHGTASAPDGKHVTYTPETDYTGTDFFFYRWFTGGVWSLPKKQCITVNNPFFTATRSGTYTKNDCILYTATRTGSFTKNDCVEEPIPVAVSFNHSKSEDPHVDITLIPLVNGVNIGNRYASESGSLTGIFAGDNVSITLAHAPTSTAWPVGASGQLEVLANSVPVFNSGPVTGVEVLATFSFVAAAGTAYTINTDSFGDSTNYLPVMLEQINNSSAPLSTSKPTVVNFYLEDNTSGEMVFDDGTYQTTQINGFNYLDQGGALADLVTLIIANNWTSSLRFVVTNYDASTTFWDVTIAAGASATLPTLPKESIRITYTDVPEGIQSLWDDTAIPAIIDDPDGMPITLGVKFKADVNGSVTGLKFYKGPSNTGVHTGALYDISGTILGSLTFADETASGWQYQMFNTPVTITANTLYVAAYFAPNGHPSATSFYFGSARVSGNLEAVIYTESQNGVYTTGGSQMFPASSFNQTNYWVDVLFVAD